MTTKRSAALLAALATALARDAGATSFRHPLGGCAGGCATITAYFDLDSSGAIRDWNCGTNTYNGHRGTDVAIYGGFSAQDAGRNIVAAADGDVIASHDGEFDRCTTGSCAGGGGFGNYVAVRHADGKVTYYAHMRRGSVRVGVGARVTCGQVIGQVGSSGWSTGPHCHFEVRVGGTAADDPFAARSGCGGSISYWVSQGAYRGLPSEACESVAPPPRDDAAVVSLNPPQPTTRRPGERYQQRWTFRNTGTTSWTNGQNYLLTHNGAETLGAPLQLRLPDGRTVAPNETHEFVADVTAPDRPGRFTSDWRMDRFGVGRFGQVATLTVVVEAPPPPPDAGAMDAGAPDAPRADADAPDGPTLDAAADAPLAPDARAVVDAASGDGALGDGARRDARGDASRHEVIRGGCGCATAGRGRPGARVLGGLGALAAALAAGRRRRRA